MDEADSSFWAGPCGEKMKIVVIACLAAAGFGCWVITDYPGEMHVDMQELAWQSAQCEVLAAGVQYQGTCDPEKNFDITGGNYSECSPYLWCAREGGECACDGTVKFGVTDGGVIMGTMTTEKVVKGSVNCTVDAFGKDPVPYHMKECRCRPAALDDIDFDDLQPPTCRRVDGMGIGSLSWVPKLGNFTGAKNGNCSHEYLPWALVKVVKGDAPPVTRCAYSYGLSHVSSSMDPWSAKLSLDRYASATGKSIHCQVPVRSRDTKYWKEGQASGRSGLGSEESCVVALESVNGTALAKWEAAWLAQVASRYNRCWFVTGFGFFIVIACFLTRHYREGDVDARELPENHRFRRPLLAA